jgi:DHA1 family bicyclomycin/chloramphenicol resistance-like MFS transporter
LLLGVLAALPALSIDISSPTLPLIPQALGTSTTVASLTVTLFMIGFAFGQLGGGRLSDRHGRRPVLLAGLACYTLAGVACAATLSGAMLLAARLTQGLGAGACFVLSFATVQDLFKGDNARARRSYVTMVFGIAPMLAPATGSVLSGVAGWRSVYAALALGGCALLIVAALGVAESRPTPLAGADHKRFRDDAKFVRITLVNALSYGGMFTFIAGSSIVIIGQMGHSSAVFSAIFACTAAALTAGAWTNGRLSRRGVQAPVILLPALIGAAGAGLALAIACLAGMASGEILLPLLLVEMFCRGTIAPNLQHLAIERWPDRAGAASAAVGVAQLLSAAFASGVVSLFLANHGATAIAVPMALLATAALIMWRRIKA